MADGKKYLPPSPKTKDGKSGSYVAVPYAVVTNTVFCCLSDKAARIYLYCLQERYRQQGRIRKMVQEEYGQTEAKKYRSDDFVLTYNMLRDTYGITGNDNGISAAFKELTSYGFVEIVGRTGVRGSRSKYNVYRLSDEYFTNSSAEEEAVAETQRKKKSKRRNQKLDDS